MCLLHTYQLLAGHDWADIIEPLSVSFGNP